MLFPNIRTLPDFRRVYLLPFQVQHDFVLCFGYDVRSNRQTASGHTHRFSFICSNAGNQVLGLRSVYDWVLLRRKKKHLLIEQLHFCLSIKTWNRLHSGRVSWNSSFGAGIIKLFKYHLYCIVLYCTVLYCIVLYCTVLHYTVLYCTVLYCTALYCIVLYCIILYCSVLNGPVNWSFQWLSPRYRPQFWITICIDQNSEK
jgi:hypothetical protein